MNLHSLTNIRGARHRKMRVGCGNASGKGKTCGRGHKGQYARSGHKHKPGFEGGQMRLIRRIPKRGFNRGIKKIFAVVPVSALDRFEEGTRINPALLRKEGLVAPNSPVKILGGGQLHKKLHVTADAFSESARKRITEAGGECLALE
jgi:large subunit ribosomal protein L15